VIFYCAYVFPLRLRVALRGKRNRNTIGVVISHATQRHATLRAAVMETSLNTAKDSRSTQ